VPARPLRHCNSSLNTRSVTAPPTPCQWTAPVNIRKNTGRAALRIKVQIHIALHDRCAAIALRTETPMARQVALATGPFSFFTCQIPQPGASPSAKLNSPDHVIHCGQRERKQNILFDSFRDFEKYASSLDRCQACARSFIAAGRFAFLESEWAAPFERDVSLKCSSRCGGVRPSKRRDTSSKERG
jgi:hypothetical protein